VGQKSREKRERREREKRDTMWGNDRPYTPPVRKYPPQPSRSTGSNVSERYLAQLCRRTFLSSWSYPNLYRAEHRADGSVQSKEVCDLLVVFENDVLIFSDKDVVFSKSDDVHKDWARWFRRAVQKSAAQLRGAERIIRAGEQLFLDAKLEHPFPLRLPDPHVMRIHRILVARGASERCRQHLGGNGTLMIQPNLVGNDHIKPAAEGGVPFVLGRVDSSKDFVHVLDDASVDLLLRTLDTAADLTAYLSRKEELILSGRLAVAAGEEALLGLYLSDIDARGKHFFRLPKEGAIALDESWWHGYRSSPEAAAKHEADKVSYAWDWLIERFAKHFREGTANHLSATDAAEHAHILRFFAREGRMRRRLLAKTVLDVIKTTEANRRRLRVIPPLEPGDPYWVILAFPYLKKVSYEQNRTARLVFLEACAMVTKLMWPDALDIVGLATESGQSKSRSEDAMCLDAREWTLKMSGEAQELQRKYGILVKADQFEFHESEYPVDTDPHSFRRVFRGTLAR
jgi:hypothetical protein